MTFKSVHTKNLKHISSSQTYHDHVEFILGFQELFISKKSIHLTLIKLGENISSSHRSKKKNTNDNIHHFMLKIKAEIDGHFFKRTVLCLMKLISYLTETHHQNKKQTNKKSVYHEYRLEQVEIQP